MRYDPQQNPYWGDLVNVVNDIDMRIARVEEQTRLNELLATDEQARSTAWDAYELAKANELQLKRIEDAFRALIEMPGSPYNGAARALDILNTN